VYAFIDRLIATRLVDTAIMGQRSMSRLEIGRILAEAQQRADSSGWLSARLREYSTAFPAIRGRNTLLLETDVTAMDAPSRGIEPDGTGLIQVRLNPLSANQSGRLIANGSTVSLRIASGLNLRPWFALGLDGRVMRLDERSGPDRNDARLDGLYARSVWRNVAGLVGRDQLFLGQGRSSSLAISTNARPVDQIRISSDRPFVLPWIFRYVGPTHVTTALGDLGKDQSFPHTRLFAYKVSSKPHARFEVGTGLVEQVGGEGAPGGTLLQKAGDAFPLLDALFLHRNTHFSNKFVFVDLRYAIPGLRGAQFYAEGSFDDFDLRRVRSVFTEDAGYIWGLSTSCIRECGPIRASAEYHVTGVRFYTHGRYTNGFTLDNSFIGNPLGPRARAAYASVEVETGRRGFTLDGAYEDRSGNLYGAVSTTPDDSDFRFLIIGRRPAERRWRATSTGTLGGISDVVTYSISGGVERVENFGHVSGAWRTNWLARFAVQYRSGAPVF
jgi:hypothetical protein